MKRNMVGYGRNPPNRLWANEAKIAVNFVINYEEGAELTPLNNDDFAETYGGEFPLPIKTKGERSLSMESLFEYGSRVGIWRLIRLFEDEHIPVTFFVTGFALTLNPELSNYLKQCDHELAGHGWRWIDYATCSKSDEKNHIQRCVETLKKYTGKKIYGWYSGRRSIHTRDLLRELGGFVYDSDSYNDDLPYLEDGHLIIPYTLDCNDFRFSTTPGFNNGSDFLQHLKDTFSYLYHEQRMALMTIGLHPRISGRPGRCMAIQQFIRFIKEFSNVWLATRYDIARYWLSSIQ